MRRKNLVIGTPHARHFTPEFVACLANTFIDLLPRFDIKHVMRESRYVHMNRNAIIGLAKEFDPDYMLFIDSDMKWKTSDIEKLIDLKKPVATGLYCRRTPINGYYPPVIYQEYDGILQLAKHIPDEPFICQASGAGFLLITKDIINKMLSKNSIKKLGLPFDPIPGITPKDGKSQFAGEDISFCARLKISKIELWCHPGVSLVHVGNVGIVYRKPMQVDDKKVSK